MSRLSLKLATMLVVSLALTLGFAKAGELGNDATKDDRYKVKVTVDGTDYIVPIYSDIKISPARRQFDQEALGKIVADLRDSLTIILDDKGFIALTARISQMKQHIGSMSKKLDALKKSGDDSENHKATYVRDIQKLLDDIVKSKSQENMEVAKLKQLADKLFRAMALVPAESPTGLYVDWAEMRIGPDREPLVKHISPIIKRISRSRYYFGLLVLNWFAGFLNL